MCNPIVISPWNISLRIFVEMADARRPLDFSRDIWSCISEFKGNTTITIDETSWVNIPTDFHEERKLTCKHQQCQWGQMENQRLSITCWQDTNNIFSQINNICLRTFKSLLRQYYSKALHSCFDAEGPRTWRSVCLNCSSCRSLNNVIIISTV
jgi:hypothetical protein